MSTDHEPAPYGLVMPFLPVASRGGPYDDGAYTAGYEMGTLDAALAAHPTAHRTTIHSANATQADLIAMHHGYRCHLEPTDYPDWTYATFTPASTEENPCR